MTEPINVILQTYQRTSYALRTIAGLRANLIYPELRWYVADDGSSLEHYQAVCNAVEGLEVLGTHTIPFGTYGRNVNRAVDYCLEHPRAGKLFLFMEDDWELTERLELYRYAAMLMERQDVGMVRLGYLNLNMSGKVFGHGGALYWRLDREADPYVYTGHPALRHDRYREAYGAYPEGLMPGETELEFALQYRQKPGPDIVWPASLGEGHIFGHIGEVASYLKD